MDLPDIDELDQAILKALQENARIPFVTLAKALNTNEKTVRNRVRQLQADGVVQLVGVINPLKAGLRVEVFIQLSVVAGQLDSVLDALNQLNEIRLVILTTGEYPILAQALFADMVAFNEFLWGKIYTIQGVQTVNVIQELRIVKSKFNFLR